MQSIAAFACRRIPVVRPANQMIMRQFSSQVVDREDMPSNSLFPVQAGGGKLHVHVHDPIVAEGKSEEELAELVRASFLKTLPLEQHPLEQISLTKESKEVSETQQTA